MKNSLLSFLGAAIFSILPLLSSAAKEFRAHEIENVVNAARENPDIALYVGQEALEANVFEDALFFLSLAADKGNAVAQSHLGRMYQFGEGVEQNYGEAFNWYGKSAKQGNTFALNAIGYMTEMGIGISPDPEKAVEFYQKAADQGMPNAQVNLAYLYQNGKGVKKDINKSIEWLKRAASQDFDLGQIGLGYAYYTGHGVEKNLELSRYWLEKAVRSGNKDAEDMLQRVNLEIAIKLMATPSKK